MWICRSGKLRKIIHNILNSVCKTGVILLVVCFFFSDIWSLGLRGSGFCWVGSQKGKACKIWECKWLMRSESFFFFFLAISPLSHPNRRDHEWIRWILWCNHSFVAREQEKEEKLEIKHLYKMENHYLICILYNSAWRTLKNKTQSRIHSM